MCVCVVHEREREREREREGEDKLVSESNVCFCALVSIF